VNILVPSFARLYIYIYIYIYISVSHSGVIHETESCRHYEIGIASRIFYMNYRLLETA
jgi:hypothetical protein